VRIVDRIRPYNLAFRPLHSRLISDQSGHLLSDWQDGVAILHVAHHMCAHKVVMYVCVRACVFVCRTPERKEGNRVFGTFFRHEVQGWFSVTRLAPMWWLALGAP